MVAPLSSSFRANGHRMLALTSLFFAYGASVVLGQSPTVAVGGTTFKGVSRPFGLTNIDFFGGIPFAEPPVGNLRFAAPVFKDTYSSNSLDATNYGSTCAQLNISAVSEDCLTLNVYRPAGVASNAKLPVLFWIYGGGFALGETDIYNGSSIVAQSVFRNTPVVFVSANYRVGPFGFPQGAEARENGALNLGLKDQLAGLQWVNKHISAFGGDPSKVTVFGQSAGSMSISYLYFNSALKDLVRGAIFESGSPSSLPWFPPERREVVWDFYVAQVPACANANAAAAGRTFACMRTATTAELLAAWAATAAHFPEELIVFVPTLDGPDGLVPAAPSTLYAQGRFAHIPFMAGTNLDEGTSFVPPAALSSDADVVRFLTGVQQPFAPAPPPAFARDVQRILALYPDVPALGSPFGTGNETFGASGEYKRACAIIGDAGFHAARRLWMQVASAAGVPAWGYHFTDQSAATDPVKGVTHGSELTYVYGLEALTNADAGVRLLSSGMLEYWLSFTTSGTPNDGRGLFRTNWPQYTPSNQVLIQFDRSNFTSPFSFASFNVIPDTYRAEQISFINSIQADLNE